MLKLLFEMTIPKLPFFFYTVLAAPIYRRDSERPPSTMPCIKYLIPITVMLCQALAGRPLLPKAVPDPTVIQLSEAPVVTEVVPYFVKRETTISQAGEYTLGGNCPLIFGLGCIAEVTKIHKPTVCTLTGIGARTSTYPCTTATTYTETTSGTTTYWWSPPPGGYPTGCSTSPADPTVVTVTTTETTTATISPSCSPTNPPLTCDKYGYLIQYSELIRIDLATGEYTSVRDNIGDASTINAIAYNPLDNFLYARQFDKNQLIRLAADGSSAVVATLPSSFAAIIGDFDTEGYYWYASGNAGSWVQLDLRPGSATYAQAVDRGTTPAVGRTNLDWVYIPVAGRYLWSIGTNPSGGASLMRWSLNTHQWEIVRNYSNIDGNFGALYGINNGTIFASDNVSGRIWAFSTIADTAPYVASTGPASSSNDGARCVLNLEV